MYRNIRLIHLVLGLFATPLLLMYAVSAIQMGHRAWFNLKPAVTIERQTVASDCSNPRDLAVSLMRTQHWRGELTRVETTPKGCSLEISSVGTTRAVRYEAASKVQSITTSRAGTIGMLNRLHHAAGLWHPSVAMATWAVVVALTSAALGGLVATGVWLWLLRKRERRLGLILVGANVAFAVTMIILLRQ